MDCIVVILSSPIWILAMVVVGALVKATSKGPVFFTQKRIGKGCTTFTIYKFRTMRIDAPPDVPTHLLRNSETYLTPIGNILRKTSLDELPQLFNILKGDMSLVGPRPALWNQYDLIAEREKYGVNDVLPGLTGWAQINGRDTLPIHAKAVYDGHYCENMGFWPDVKILFMTMGAVIQRKDIGEREMGDPPE